MLIYSGLLGKRVEFTIVPTQEIIIREILTLFESANMYAIACYQVYDPITGIIELISSSNIKKMRVVV